MSRKPTCGFADTNKLVNLARKANSIREYVAVHPDDADAKAALAEADDAVLIAKHGWLAARRKSA